MGLVRSIAFISTVVTSPDKACVSYNEFCANCIICSQRVSWGIFGDSSVTVAQWWRVQDFTNLVMRRFPVRFRPKKRQLRFTWIWANWPSSKGCKLLFPVMKANQIKTRCSICLVSKATLMQSQSAVLVPCHLCMFCTCTFDKTNLYWNRVNFRNACVSYISRARSRDRSQNGWTVLRYSVSGPWIWFCNQS